MNALQADQNNDNSSNKNNEDNIIHQTHSQHWSPVQTSDSAWWESLQSILRVVWIQLYSIQVTWISPFTSTRHIPSSSTVERSNGRYSKEYQAKNTFNGINGLATPNNLLIIVAFALLVILIVMVIFINRVSKDKCREIQFITFEFHKKNKINSFYF